MRRGTVFGGRQGHQPDLLPAVHDRLPQPAAADIQQGAIDRIHWFYSLDSAGRRQYSEDTATNIYYEQMATHWGNWAKIFFNNKGVVAKATDVCEQIPQGRHVGLGLDGINATQRRPVSPDLGCPPVGGQPNSSVLPTGHTAGTPEDALDTACGLYLGDPTAWT